MRPLEVVVLDKQRHAPLAIVEVGEYGPRQELLPHRLPEALDLAARLWVVRAALHVRDAVALELLLKGGRPPPRRVLPPLVREDLARRSVIGDPARERFHHQGVALVMRHRETHHVARVIVEEGGHVHPLVPPQQEREEIRLPQLVGLGALEALRLPARLRHALRLRARDLGAASRLEHAAHRRLRGPEPEEATHDVTNPAAARLRIRLLRRDHRCMPRISLVASLVQVTGSTRHRFDRGRSTPAVAPRPFAQRRRWNPEPPSHLGCRDALVHHHRRGR